MKLSAVFCVATLLLSSALGMDTSNGSPSMSAYKKRRYEGVPEIDQVIDVFNDVLKRGFKKDATASTKQNIVNSANEIARVYNDLAANLDVAKRDLDALKKELEKKDIEIAAKEFEVEMELMKKFKLDMDEQVATMARDKSELVEKVQSGANEIASLQQIISNGKSELEKLASEKAALEARNSELNSQVETLVKTSELERTENAKNTQSLNEMISQLQEQLASGHGTLQSVQSENANIKSEYQAFVKTTELEKSDFAKNTQSLNEMIAQLQDQLASGTVQLQTVQNENTALKNEYQKLANEKLSLQADYETLKQAGQIEIERLSQTIANGNAQLSAQSNEIQCKLNEANQLKCEQDELVMSLQNQVSALQADINEKGQNYQRVQETLLQLGNVLSIAHEGNLFTVVERSKDVFVQVKSENDLLKAQNEDLQEENENYKAQLSGSNQNVCSLEIKLKEQKRDLQIKLSKLEAEYNQMQAEKKTLEEKLGNAQTEREVIKKERDALLGEKKALNSEISKFKETAVRSLMDAEVANKSVQEKEKIIREREIVLREKENAIRALQERIQASEKSIKEKEEIFKSSQEKFSVLLKKYEGEKSVLTSDAQKLKDEIRGLKTRLSNCNNGQAPPATNDCTTEKQEIAKLSKAVSDKETVIQSLRGELKSQFKACEEKCANEKTVVTDSLQLEFQNERDTLKKQAEEAQKASIKSLQEKCEKEKQSILENDRIEMERIKSGKDEIIGSLQQNVTTEGEAHKTERETLVQELEEQRIEAKISKILMGVVAGALGLPLIIVSVMLIRIQIKRRNQLALII